VSAHASDDLVRRALDVNWRNLALGHETFEAEGATFVRGRDFPLIYDANFVFGVTASTQDEIESLLARARKEYAHCRELTFRVDTFTPAAFVARLALEGTMRGSGALVLLLEGAPAGAPPVVDIRPMATEEDWAAFRELKREDWREHAARNGDDPDRIEIPDGLAAANRRKCPPGRYFAAWVDGAPRGHFSAWEGIDGVGQVEDLYVTPSYRKRGVATALLHHCVADARTHGAGPIVIVADSSDTPKQIYARMGWRPIALCGQFALAL